MDNYSNSGLNQDLPQNSGYTKDERMWAMIAHLSAVVGFVIPFGNVIAPLLIWILKKDESAFINDQGKEALNFQISVTIYAFISIILVFLLIGIPILIALAIFVLIFVIIASINSYDGKAYRYPLTIRLIK
ncbi:MAG: DUF4870 domain-containing protein [Ignavibacteriae bacterium]|nr:DUF4870 domain-containing protein [Ignavibacteriota bacterium]